MNHKPTPLQTIANAAALRAGQPAPAPMHENPALALAMQQLNDAADKSDALAKTHKRKWYRGFYMGRADAYRHVISVLAQTKV